VNRRTSTALVADRTVAVFDHGGGAT